MIRLSILRRYYVIAAMIMLIFIALGLSMSREVMRLTASPGEDRHSAFYARLIDRLNPLDRVQALSELTELNAGGMPYHFALIGADGAVIAPPHFTLPPSWKTDWSMIDKPQEIYGVERPSALGLGAGPGQSRSLVRLPGSPPEYLLVSIDRGGGRGPRSSTVFFSTFGSLAVSALLGIAIAMILLFYSLRKKVALADSVLDELQRGNLKARFPLRIPLRETDEIGRAMSRFNRMADEIERLVEQLRSVEKSRMTLLQELAHDLRTPVASLKNLLETLSVNRLAGETREELMSLALKEVDYFARLIEDLLVLAQVSEPRYVADRRPISLNELLEDEADSVALHSSPRTLSQGPRISLRKTFPQERAEVPGDALLLRRMIRNVLENAFSFARSEVHVQLQASDDETIRITVEDDGPGFSEEALRSFGERRVSRTLGSASSVTPESQRLSVGLGSVITRTIARLHRGEAQAGNRTDDDGRIEGASVIISLRGSRI